ncbi:hypothetical protein [Halomonas sp.]|uniref:hypothetical protein n=1 Tax=Halomonas sp. TaxID=1486246 RepID=UPI0025BA249D|nr:hypothetical protein [Halomonas sp.]
MALRYGDSRSVHHLDGAVIVTVIPMGVMEVAIHQVIDVITVGDRLMATPGAVDMVGVMALTLMLRGAAVRIGITDADHVFVDMVLVRVMKMAVMQIVDVAIVLDGGVTAAWTMFVIVMGMNLAGHGNLRSGRKAR